MTQKSTTLEKNIATETLIMKDLLKMAWQPPSDYSAPDIEAIKRKMRLVNDPSVGGTYLAMKPIVFDGKTPFLSYDGTGETGTDAPLNLIKPGEHSRTAAFMMILLSPSNQLPKMTERLMRRITDQPSGWR